MFTKMDITNLPDKGPPGFAKMPKITTTERGVRKRLEYLDVHMTTGPDNLYACFDKSFSDQL